MNDDLMIMTMHDHLMMMTIHDDLMMMSRIQNRAKFVTKRLAAVEELSATVTASTSSYKLNDDMPADDSDAVGARGDDDMMATRISTTQELQDTATIGNTITTTTTDADGVGTATSPVVVVSPFMVHHDDSRG